MAYYIDENRRTAVKYEGKSAFTWNVSTRRFDLPVSDVSPKSRMTRCSEFEARRYLFEHDPADYVGMGDLLDDIWDEIPDQEPDMSQSVEQAEAYLQERAAQRAKFEPHLTNYRNGIQAYVMGISKYGTILESVEEFLSNDELIAQTALQIARGNEQLAELKVELAKCESGPCEECKWYNSCEKHPNPVNPVNPVQE